MVNASYGTFLHKILINSGLTLLADVHIGSLNNFNPLPHQSLGYLLSLVPDKASTCYGTS